MKKILVVVTTAFVKTGGLTSVMMNYWRAMDKTDLSFDFASTNVIDDLLSEEISKEGCLYYQLPPRKNVLKYFTELHRICKGYDVIHIHANSATSVIELMAARMAGVPNYLSAHILMLSLVLNLRANGSSVGISLLSSLTL